MRTGLLKTAENSLTAPADACARPRGDDMHTLSLHQASDLLKRIGATRQANGSLFDVVMPNGKRFGDCRKEDFVQLSKALQRLGFETESERFNRLAFHLD